LFKHNKSVRLEAYKLCNG